MWGCSPRRCRPGEAGGFQPANGYVIESKTRMDHLMQIERVRFGEVVRIIAVFDEAAQAVTAAAGG